MSKSPKAPQIVDVVVPVALDQAYSYRVPAGMTLAPGDFVACRWAKPNIPAWSGARAIRGPACTTASRTSTASSISRRCATSCATSSTGSSDYTLGARGMVLRMTLRMGEHLGPGARARRRAARRSAAAAHDARRARACCALLADGMARAKSDAAQEAGVSTGVIDGLIDEGTLETIVLPPDPVAQPPDPDFMQPDFIDAQREAARCRCAISSTKGDYVRRADRRRHRLGQDRSLFRGRGRERSGAASRR